MKKRVVSMILVLAIFLSVSSFAQANELLDNLRARLQGISTIIEFGDGKDSDGYAWWKNASGDKLSIQFQIHNPSSTYTVVAFELYVYAVNVWGERIYGEDTVYYHTTEKKIAPGKTIKSDYITIPNRSQIHSFYCAISRVIYKDASGCEYTKVVDSKDLHYLCWDYND